MYNENKMKSIESEFMLNNKILNTAFTEDKNYEGLCSRFNHVIKEKLDKISNGRREQLHILLISIMEIVYYKYTESTESIVYFPFTNSSERERIIPLSNSISGEMSYKELVKRVSTEFSKYKKDRCLLVELDKIDMKEVSLSMLFIDRNMTKEIQLLGEQPRIIFEFVELDDQYSINIYTRENEKEPYRYDKVIQYYMMILNTVLFDASKPIKDIDYMSESEQRHIIQTLNANRMSDANTDMVYKKFEEQVCKTPDRIAIKDETEEITYAKLYEKANRIAHYLKEKGFCEENVIAIEATRDINMIAAILGTIKIGAYYLPIDITYPEERIKYMIINSKAKILFGRGFAFEIKGLSCIDLDDEEIRNSDCSNLVFDFKKTQPFYLIYTSGSTGKPKGVQVRNDSFYNLLQWYIKISNLQEDDNILLMLSPGFDMSQKNFFAPLLVGAKLTLTQMDSFEYDRITNLIENDKVSIINTTPSIFYPLLDFNRNHFDKLRSLKKVYLGGEAIHGNKLREWMRSPECKCQIYNIYGPTECTDIATCYEIQLEQLQDELPIGKPIPGVNVYILDKNKKLVPVGIEGELFIGGLGVSNGYIHDPNLAEEIFSELRLEGVNDRVYATGDIVRCSEEGNLYFIGRRDFQYKIRGLRVDVSEIESSLMEIEHVVEAIVVVKNDENEEKSLVAFVRCEKKIDLDMIKEQLKNSLPSYMVPNKITVLSAFPINTHGKIDRKKLEQMIYKTSSHKAMIAPNNFMEEKILNIWASIIHGDVNEMSTNVNFLDLGGDSIKLIYMLSIINKEFHVQLQVGDMFTYSTVKKLAARLSSNESTERKEAVNIEEEHGDNVLKYCYQFNTTMVQMIDWYTKKNKLSTEEFLLGAFLYTICNNQNQPKSRGILIKENRQFACQLNLEQCENKEDIFQQLRDSLQDISTNRDDFQYEFLFTMDSSNLYVSRDIQLQLSARAETAINFDFYTNRVNYKEKALRDFVSTYINVIGSLVD